MITIEKARPEDAKALLAHLKTVGGETENLTFDSEGMHFTEEEEAAFIAYVEKSGDGIMLIAKDGDKIVGEASLHRQPRRMRHRGDFGISVLKEYWNQGIGSRMLREIIAFAKENSFDIIDLQVRSDNERAVHLYEKFGFQKTGSHPAFFKIRGEEISFDYMYVRVSGRKEGI